MVLAAPSCSCCHVVAVVDRVILVRSCCGTSSCALLKASCILSHEYPKRIHVGYPHWVASHRSYARHDLWIQAQRFRGTWQFGCDTAQRPATKAHPKGNLRCSRKRRSTSMLV